VPRHWTASSSNGSCANADILAGLTHPHIARLYDAGVTETGLPYLALELVEGQALTVYAATHQLGFASASRSYCRCSMPFNTRIAT
jgi:serine/threonine protein kinase